MPSQTFTELVGGSALFGVAGWGLENVLSEKPRYSAIFGGHHVPFLPVYAAGGGLVLALAPALKAQNLPWFVRAAVYSGVLTGAEWVGCQLDRSTLGARSWDYGKAGAHDGCIDIKHSVAWGLLGLLAEQFAGAVGGRGSPRDQAPAR